MTDDHGAAALAERLEASPTFHGLTLRYGRFNGAWWDRFAAEVLGEHGVFLPDDREPTWHHSPDAPPDHFCEDCDFQRAEVEWLRAALQAIAEDDDLVKASGGAWGQQAYERRRDIARAALSPETR